MVEVLVAKKFPPKVHAAVVSRAESDAGYPACEAMIPGVCTGSMEHWHHRQLRSQGGEHTVPNGLGCCSKCHNAIHADPATSYEQGWLVHGWDDPAKIVVLRRGHWVQLREDGSFVGVKF